MGGLGHRSGVGGNRTGPRGRDSQCHASLLSVQPQHYRTGGGAAHHTHQPRRVEPFQREVSGGDSDAPLHLEAGYQGCQDVLPGGAPAFGHRAMMPGSVGDVAWVAGCHITS